MRRAHCNTSGGLPDCSGAVPPPQPGCRSTRRRRASGSGDGSLASSFTCFSARSRPVEGRARCVRSRLPGDVLGILVTDVTARVLFVMWLQSRFIIWSFFSPQTLSQNYYQTTLINKIAYYLIWLAVVANVNHKYAYLCRLWSVHSFFSFSFFWRNCIHLLNSALYRWQKITHTLKKNGLKNEIP